MMEKIIVKHLLNYVLEHHIITEHQSGFQSKDSTVNQHVYIYNTIISNLDIGKDIRFIFCDISKSFDRVWHTGLLYKLRKIGNDGNLKSSILQSRSSTISFMYIRNRKGPNTDPWVTPASIPSHSDENPFIHLRPLFVSYHLSNL
jgi:hypothetical protein